jgi:hypothetical protein
MGRTEAEQKAYEEGRREGASAEQIITIFHRLTAIEDDQSKILTKLESLNSFRAWVLGAAAVVSTVISAAAHFIMGWGK